VLILNCDGVGATTGANRINESYTAEDRRPFYVLDGIQSLKSLDAAVTKAEKAVALGCKSVALDTANILVDYLTAELTEQFKDDGFSVYRELEFAISKAVRRLKKLNAHLFVTGHMTPGYEGEAGVLPSVGGKLKTKIPGMLHDMILMDCVASRKPNERSFIVGPQDKWNSSGRNIKKSCVIEADVTLLLETLGIEP
jgi:hypothetical protein